MSGKAYDKTYPEVQSHILKIADVTERISFALGFKPSALGHVILPNPEITKKFPGQFSHLNKAPLLSQLAYYSRVATTLCTTWFYLYAWVLAETHSARIS